MIFFSKKELTFIDDNLSSALPDDAQVISALEHAVLYAGVAAGKAIDFSGDRPVLVDRPPPTVEQFRQAALLQRDRELSIAALRIGPLQDAVDVGRATEEEAASLLQWKGYRIDLMRIEQQKGFPTAIGWPLSPDSGTDQ
ncbi:tail fiber assembly protein [Pseudomonas sp. TKO29]|uniref:tail fiber assembly protein n=1 Tax=Pseudomonas sp. TKO29 TaxID=2052591 RepID=UPI002114DC05|nr:tail fiber assembly protein [Pseudomonas sp. TKO29]